MDLHTLHLRRKLASEYARHDVYARTNWGHACKCGFCVTWRLFPGDAAARPTPARLQAHMRVLDKRATVA